MQSFLTFAVIRDFVPFPQCRRVADYNETAKPDGNLPHYREELMDVVRYRLQQELFSDQEVGGEREGVVHNGNKDMLLKYNLEEYHMMER